jgi:hypothetical protein
VRFADLPAKAQSFVLQYYNVSDVAHVERERDGLYYDYQVYLNNATELDFDHQGILESIDCKRNPVPEGIVPAAIVKYVQMHYGDLFVVEYVVEHRYLQVELNNGLELVFDHEGRFVRIDD